MFPCLTTRPPFGHYLHKDVFSLIEVTKKYNWQWNMTILQPYNKCVLPMLCWVLFLLASLYGGDTSKHFTRTCNVTPAMLDKLLSLFWKTNSSYVLNLCKGLKECNKESDKMTNRILTQRTAFNFHLPSVLTGSCFSCKSISVPGSSLTSSEVKKEIDSLPCWNRVG